MSFPSAACQTCKLRRIKCDETRPVCGQCLKSRRNCATSEDQRPFHVENLYASGEHHRPRGPRSNPSIGYGINSIATTSSVRVSHQTQATNYYLRNYLCTPADIPSISKSTLDYILPVWWSMRDSTLLDLAISCIALAVYSRLQHCPSAALEASEKYHQLLQVAKVRLSCLDRVNIDASLIAVLLMSRYENIMHDARPSPPTDSFIRTFKGFSHHDGSLAILEYWKTNLSHTQMASEVIKHTRRAMIKSALLRSLPVTPWMLEGSSFGEQDWELEHDRIIIRIANIRGKLATHMKQKTNQQENACDAFDLNANGLEEETRQLQSDLRGWTIKFPSSWRYRKHGLTNWSRGDFFATTVFSTCSPTVMTVWTRYYSTMMLVASTQLEVLELIDPDPSNTRRSTCLLQLGTAADKLASSIPFALHRFTVTRPTVSSDQETIILDTAQPQLIPYMADLAAWPLSIASGLRYINGGQKIWFRSQLAHVGRILGDKILESQDSGSWFQLPPQRPDSVCEA